MEGGRWDRKRRSLSRSQSRNRFVAMPLIWAMPSPAPAASSPEEAKQARIATKKQAERHPEMSTTLYPTSAYRTPARGRALRGRGMQENLVAVVDLPSYDPVEVWMFSGLALLLSTGS